MSREVKCRIKKYDPAVTAPPYEFITLGDFTCEERDSNDEGGVEFYRQLSIHCIKQGYRIKFYSISKHIDYDFDVVVLDDDLALGEGDRQ